MNRIKKISKLGAGFLATLLFLMFVSPAVFAASMTVKWIDYDTYFEVCNQTGDSAGTNGAWAATDYYQTNNSRVAYCLQAHKDCPNSDGASYSTADSFSDAETREGIYRILESGYPIKSASSLGVSSASEARAATAMAVRMWMYKQKGYKPHAAGGSYVPAPGKLKGMSGHGDAYNLSVKLYNRALHNTKINRSITLSPASGKATLNGNKYVFKTKVTLSNYSGYKLDKSKLPSGASVVGFTGASGDNLTISVPAGLANASKTFQIVVSAKAKGIKSSFTWIKPAKTALQTMVEVNTSNLYDSTTKSFSFTTPAMGYGKVIKVDADTNTSVAQGDADLTKAVFSIYKKDGTKVEELVIGANKTATSGKLLAGEYYMLEKGAGTGYLTNTKQYPFTVSENKTTEVKIPNTVMKGQIKIHKLMEDPDTATSEVKNEPLPGVDVEFDIIHKSSGKLIETIKCDETGTAISSLLPYGKYIVSEKKVDGYDLLNPFEVDITKNGEILSYEFENKLTKVGIAIKKLSAETEEPLLGATVEVYNHKEELIETLVTDEQGQANAVLPLGNYHYKEISAPETYSLSVEDYGFEVTDKETMIGDTTFKNEPNIIEVQKVDKHNQEPLEGVHIGLYNADTDTLIRTYITNEEGRIIVKGLECGRYYFKEVKPLDGYKENDKKYDFEITPEYINGGDPILIENVRPLIERIINPQTGDISPLYTLIGMIGISICGLIFTLYQFKKSKSKAKGEK